MTSELVEDTSYFLTAAVDSVKELVESLLDVAEISTKDPQSKQVLEK